MPGEKSIRLPVNHKLVLQEKLKRLIKDLNFKDMKNKTQKQTSQDDDEVLEASGKCYDVN